MKIIGIIPARYASTRFPGKPLIDIEGKSMIQRVYEQATKSKSLDKVVVATDDQRIFDHVHEFGGEVILTKMDHPSGTDRCYEALCQLEEAYDFVINIQGDEPFIDPSQIDKLVQVLEPGITELATLIIKVANRELLFDEGEVKVVLNKHHEALYFSRSVIPFMKSSEPKDWARQFLYYRHVGMYAYRLDVLKQITQLPVSSLEAAESLEQLRWLENGYKIKCAFTDFESHCIDLPEDVSKVLKMLHKES